MFKASRLRHLAGALLALALLGGIQSPAQAEASFTQHRLGDHDYWVYQPSGYVPGQALPLVVYLHGCGEYATDVATGTRWSETAEQGNFLVLYPDQSRLANPGKCWNWSVPGNQQRGQGDAGLIADMTRAVMAQWSVDARRVYVLGFSAGAGMTSIMGVAYPDLYAAVGMFAGCAYNYCSDALNGEQGYAAMGSYARPVPAIMFGGTADPTYVTMLGNLQQWLKTDDLADDGLANGSVPQSAASAQSYAGDAQTHPYKIDHYRDRDGRPLIDFYSVYGATHLYYGGNTEVLWTDPLGPGITPAAWAFFTAHPMP